MSRLAAEYRAARAAYAVAMPEPEELESTLAGFYARGRARHPEVSLSDVAFVRHLARCKARVAEQPEATHAEDLFLACAAIAGEARAVDKLRLDFQPVVAGYLRHLSTAGAVIDDLQQSLWTALLVGDAVTPPKLASYSGSGSLAGFVGVTAQRLALRSLGHEAAAKRAAASAAIQAKILARDAEMDFAKHRYRDEFERAVKDALEVLDDRQRMVLRMQVVDGLTVDRIAKVYGVSQSTISRWLEKARAAVLQEARRALRKYLQLTDSEFDWLVEIMFSQLDVSMSSVIQRDDR